MAGTKPKGTTHRSDDEGSIDTINQEKQKQNRYYPGKKDSNPEVSGCMAVKEWVASLFSKQASRRRRRRQEDKKRRDNVPKPIITSVGNMLTDISIRTGAANGQQSRRKMQAYLSSAAPVDFINAQKAKEWGLKRSRVDPVPLIWHDGTSVKVDGVWEVPLTITDSLGKTMVFTRLCMRLKGHDTTDRPITLSRTTLKEYDVLMSHATGAWAFHGSTADFAALRNRSSIKA
ncbi:hypothetical protein GMORB2_3683 [Geosmithia morbida]|uniref:Uncharacterized protein n=1 Tax=Geosmithia morbida TaxID=1094350 RepID=A0A9P4Z1D5_9HYPO|nr:uncharacterized protein GMORB2_3683 [Geosmithia morbida]KAF4124844.1 hypothetical protein GMORB2_3683 [Geosmithia morbida]